MRDTTIAIVSIAVIVICALCMGERAVAISKEILPLAFTAIGSLATGIVIGRKSSDKNLKESNVKKETP